MRLRQPRPRKRRAGTPAVLENRGRERLFGAKTLQPGESAGLTCRLIAAPEAMPSVGVETVLFRVDRTSRPA